MEHFFSVDQLSIEAIYSLCEQAKQCKKQEMRISEQIFAGNVFTEPSTRTKLSFTFAQRKLGLDVLEVDGIQSSIVKGESLEDTVITLEAIGANLLIIRDGSNEWMEELQDKVSIPMINAGAGTAEHPTQCMLDVFTLYEEFGSFEGLHVVIAGDVKHSRVAHSNIRTLQRLGANVYTSCAESFVDETLNVPNISMDEAVKVADCLMLLRIQHERHQGEDAETNDYLQEFGLTIDREQQMKQHSIIMHPGPVNRGVEIDGSLMYGNRSRLKQQIQNGVYMRMSIMLYMLKKWGIIHESIINERTVCEQ
ncbi:MAG TPA: aspartate carbamoyltransferase catalytic subunit [Bacillota bacterium]|nr:aspartate carbamoyltransferase catalytic subunit [Bacillota bacterium]